MLAPNRFFSIRRAVSVLVFASLCTLGCSEKKPTEPTVSGPVARPCHAVNRTVLRDTILRCSRARRVLMSTTDFPSTATEDLRVAAQTRATTSQNESRAVSRFIKPQAIDSSSYVR